MRASRAPAAPGRTPSCPGRARWRYTFTWARGARGCPSPCRCAACGRARDGRVTDVVLDVAGMAWFERLLLQLGPDASVVRPPELTDLAATAARKVLRLYEEGSGEHA